VDAEESSKRPAAPTAPARKESLWVLERADNLLGEIATALWLSIASVWRIPRAAVARDSMARLDTLVANRQALPPRLNLLVASITSALLLSVLLPQRTPHLTADALLSWLATTSPENWLLAAAPALISLWLTVIVLGRALRQASGAGSDEPTGILMHVASAVTILSCLGIVAVGTGEARLNAMSQGLPDLVVLTGFWLMMGLLAVAGVRCAQQLTASSGYPGWRRGVLLFVGPLAFISSVLVALVATYWLLQAQALGSRMIGESKPVSDLTGLSPTCSVTAGSVTCQMLLSADSDLAIGNIRQVDIEWRDLRRMGQFTKVSLLQQTSQIVQLAPHVEPGGFWILRAKEPSPFAFQIARPDACRLYQDIAAFRRRVKPMTGVPPSPPLEIWLGIYWQPGSGLVSRKDASISPGTSTEEFADPELDSDLTTLCDETSGAASHPNGRE
jgi:hypothetical protein